MSVGRLRITLFSIDSSIYTQARQLSPIAKPTTAMYGRQPAARERSICTRLLRRHSTTHFNFQRVGTGIMVGARLTCMCVINIVVFTLSLCPDEVEITNVRD